MWPDWLSQVIPKNCKSANFKIGMSFLNGNIYIQPELKMSQAPSGSKKLKLFCESCNTGWANQIESAARPILTELIQGYKGPINFHDQIKIVNWIFLFSYVAEYTDIRTKAITDAEIKIFYQERRLPDNTFIWISNIDPTQRWDDKRYIHNGILGKASSAEALLSLNIQTTTISLGNFFATSLTIGNGSPLFNNLEIKNANLLGLKRIYPLNFCDINLDEITDAQADFYADYLYSNVILPKLKNYLPT